MTWPVTPSPRVLRWIQIAVGIGLLAILWNAADGPEAVRILSSANPLWLIAAVLALSLQTFLSAHRWRLTARPLGIHLRVGRAVREYYLSQIVNQSLPGGMVGDAGRAVRSQQEAGLLRATQAVIFERLAGQVAMFVLLATSFFATWWSPGGFYWPRWIAAPLALVLLAGLALPIVFLASTRLPGALGRSLSGLKESMRVALLSPRVLPWQVTLSIGTAACNLAAFAACATAINANLPPIAIVTIVPLILFTMFLPISVGGWGIREGAAAALFPLVGATSSQGFATSVAFGLAFLVAVLPGIIPLWFGSKTSDTRTSASSG